MIANMPLNFQALNDHYRTNEQLALKNLLQTLDSTLSSTQAQKNISNRAETLVTEIRGRRLKKGGINAFMAEFDLSNSEGLALMCLAEALLRIPDPLTMDRLIRDKLSKGNWKKHLGKSESLFVNAASFGLMLAKELLPKPQKHTSKTLGQALGHFFSRSTEATIRHAMRYAMRILGNHFVMGETISDAQSRALQNESRGYRYSYDMLGEAAKTEADAERYQKEYTDAIIAIGKASPNKSLYERAGISIKLSALFSRYEYLNMEEVLAILLPRARTLCLLAKQYDISLTIDAEESDRLIPSLFILENLSKDPELAGWNGLGLAVQAYQRRAMYVLDYLQELARESGRRLMVRLVKGAYWDSEIKMAQEQGQADYPVFTRKPYTDVSYLACAKKMLASTDVFYPMFATHNAYSVSAIFEMAGSYRDYEFQCLHGMGDTLYDQVVKMGSDINMPCRIYAPVGSHKDLLAYLVRRLLENGANSSFVNQILDIHIPVSALVENPLQTAKDLNYQSHPAIPLPLNIYGEKRMNSKGLDLSNPQELARILNELHECSQSKWLAMPMLADPIDTASPQKEVFNPADTSEVIGHVILAGEAEAEKALQAAVRAFSSWQNTSAKERALLLRRAADLLETNMLPLMAMSIREAGKSIANAIGEVREAVDFCRYYAEQSETFFQATPLKGITGESNQLEWHGRGVMVCISPWNFPLAIFLGEITAALAAGNVVIAKPAAQTTLIATFAIELLHQAGFPRDVLQMLPGPGRTVGEKLICDPRIAGVIFTGSTDTAHHINVSLAAKKGPIVPFIAETGGQNAMVVDSSALPEQVVRDVIASSFDSAGQRCSALRVVFIQEDIADHLLEMLKGAMAELKVGNPMLIHTDVGPVIDQASQKNLLDHIEKMKTAGKILYQTPLDASTQKGYFVAPTLIEIPHISTLTHEVFGPVLHVLRFQANQLDDVIAQINSTGFGLTFGIHSRIDTTIQYFTDRIHAGNLYVNRNMIGAVVGVQPFGGEGLSGTGPKAGGPNYLPRLALERVVSINTTASGGNASLMSLEK